MSSAVPVTLRPGRPLTPAQRPLWTSQRRHLDTPVQNMPLLTHLDGPIDADRLAAAFAEVVAESDALRTTILDDGAATTVVVGDEPAKTEILDIDRADARAWAQRRAAIPVSMRRVGYDSVILRHEDQTTSWYLNLHHTITDATSSAIVFAATAAVYAGEPVAVGSYYEWANSLSERAPARRERAMAHWRARPAAPAVGRLYTAARRMETAAERCPVALDSVGWSQVEEALGGRYRMLSDDLAWATLLITAASVHLHRVSGADAFSIGMPVHNRGDERTRDLIGPLMEVFPVDVRVDAGDTFRELHERVSRSVLETLRHAQPGTAPAADYEAVVNVILRGAPGHFGPVPATTEWIHSGAIDGAHLLRVQLMAYAGEPELMLDVNEGAADDTHRARVADHFEAIVAAMVADPDQPVLASTLCTDDELEILRRWGTGPARRSDRPVGVVSLLNEGLSNRSDVALEHDGRQWTGQQLWTAAQGVARRLRADGVEPGDRVAVELPRSADAVIAILGILVAGGSYVPLDPSQPLARRDRLAARAGCRVRLSTLPDEMPGEAIEERPGADDEAYLLFTSGSTGEPKGVPISHHGLAGYLEFAADAYVDPAQPPVVALFTALTFDLTVTSLFLALITGGRLVVIGDDGPAGLRSLADHTEITWAKATPSHLEILERLLPADHRLDTLVVGGEAFGANLGRRLLAWRDRSGQRRLRIFNEYGPTEAVVGCMIHETSAGELGAATEVPIGRPAPGVTLRIVDGADNDVPIGAPGELLISHDGVTSGYLDGTAADASRFATIDGHRFYRSGDLVRLLDEDTLVYLGRIDAQVKVGGIRLEPSEVEDALKAHPRIRGAAVRLWTPKPNADRTLCVRCGLSSEVPGVSFDDAGVCSSCAAYDRVAPQAESWFRTPDDLQVVLERARAAATGNYDCLHLLSGGKDSTYALYQLVEHGFRPYVLTLDNGFIAEGALENVRRSVENLGLDHEFATTESMNEIFQDSLDRFSNVCNGCYKTIYTLAITRAVELGIPLIVTGLSRGQLFETRLIPQQFREGRFDPDAIDRAVIEARKAYHQVDDAARRLLDTSVFDDEELFEKLEFLDFYRYVDVPLSEMFAYLDSEAPWVRPDDTGRSTNCLINVAGIHTHLREQGYHNYAMPYAWDVRLGHKTRDEALDELDDEIDLIEVERMLAEVDYEPRTRPVLTAWLDVRPGDEAPSPAELRAFLADRVPSYAIPSAFVVMDELPVTTNGKLDDDALPAPSRVHRPGPAMQVPPDTDLERTIISVWERVLRIEPIGVEDDFFALGGDSLSALEMIVAVGDELGLHLREDYAFSHATVRSLAGAIDAYEGSTARAAHTTPVEWAEPPLSDGERAILFEQSTRDPNAGEPDVRYNTARVYRIDGPIDAPALADAIKEVAGRHVPLTWGYGSPRRRLDPEAAVDVEVGSTPITVDELAAGSAERHRRPFDLVNGPLLRAWIQPVDDGTSQVLLAMHHASGDAFSFDRLWEQIDAAAHGREPVALSTDYASFNVAQREARRDQAVEFWTNEVTFGELARFAIHPPPVAEPDGYVSRTMSVTPDELRVGTGVGGFVTAFTAIAATLRAYADGDRLALAFVASTRAGSEARDLAGYFLNTVPVDVDVSRSGSLRALGEAARVETGRRLAHRTLPYAEILAARRAAGVASSNLDIMMSFEELDAVSFGGAEVDHTVLFNGTAVADLTFFVKPRPDSVDVGIEYRGSAVSEAVARGLLADVETALRTYLDAADTTVGELPQPSTEDVILHGRPLADTPSVVDRMLHHVDTRPAEPAVACGDGELDWATLGDRSAAVARGLRDRGVGHGDRVVVALPRSVDQVATVVGILRAGAAYVPIDPTAPEDRIEMIAHEAGARFAVTAVPGARLTEGDIAVADLLTPDADTPPFDDVTPDPDHEAYVIFTSGSTGVPRGVAVRHGELARSTAAREVYYPESPERFLVVSSLGFDSSVAGLFWTLTTGGTVVLPTEAEAKDPGALLRLVSDGRTTHTLMVPTLYRAALERGIPGPWPRRVIVAGEAAGTALVALHHRSRPASVLTNEYGPTEATVWATATDLEADDSFVSIGGPIPGTWVAVVDAALRPRPAGVEGELVIGGPNVTQGYVNDPAATIDRFVSAPELPGRVFRTGDAAVVVDGAVRFLGRRDNQLNLGGVRAEPEEIERALTEVDGVSAVVVVASDPRTLEQLMAKADVETLQRAMAVAGAAADPAAALGSELRAALPGASRLVAHVEGSIVDLEALRGHAEQTLPPALRPVSYAVHEHLPRSAHGKIDRRAAAELPLSTAASSAEDAGPANELVAEIGRLMGELLGTDPLGPSMSFFDAGGHSLLVMEFLTRIAERHGVTVGPAAFYRDPTPAAVARSVGPGTELDTGSEAIVVPIRADGTAPPLFGLHVLGPEESFYRPLAEEMGAQQPVYGVNVPLEDQLVEDVVDLVSDAYVAAIEQVAPTGPVGLAAISMGSSFAFETARKLHARGRDLSIVALFDAKGPDAWRYAPSRVDRLRLRARQAVSDPRTTIRRLVGGRMVRVRRHVERAKLALRSRSGRRLSHDLEIRRVIENNIVAVGRHDFEPADIRITLFKATHDPNLETEMVARGMGWERVARAGVDVVVVEGGHMSMLQPPFVSGLATAFAQVLDSGSGTTPGAPDEPLPRRDRDQVEDELIEALGADRVGVAVAQLRERGADALTADALDLVAEVEAALGSMAATMRSESARVAAVLGAGGVGVEATTIPDRLLRAVIEMRVRPDDLTRTIELLNSVGYRMQRPLSPAAWEAHRRLHGDVMLITTDAWSTRLHLVWGGQTAKRGPSRFQRVLAPTEHDLTFVDLPGWCWPGYFAVRPARLVLDRIRGRRGGGDLGPFLATPEAMLAPLMAAADLAPTDLLVDVGCGDGRVVIDAARRHGCRTRGVEREPALAELARANVEAARLSHLVEIIEGDVDAASLRDATVVFSFLPPKATAAIVELAEKVMAPGSRVITHEQLASEWPREPDRAELVVGQGLTVARVWHLD